MAAIAIPLISVTTEGIVLLGGSIAGLLGGLLLKLAIDDFVRTERESVPQKIC